MNSREDILNRLLEAIPEEYDKSEGSFFYDNLASVAIELDQGYQTHEAILSQGFVNTATGNYLDMLCEEKGISRKQATKATGTVFITGGEGARIQAGDKVASDTLTYSIEEDYTITGGEIEVKVVCDTEGEAGNAPVGAIKYFPITLSGLTGVTNKQPLVDGYDMESDEALRERYYTKVRTPATSGNKHHYKLWAKEVTGVGDAKVFPLASGPGTVGIVIIDRNKEPANRELVDKVIEHIEEARPIGAIVGVESATGKQLNIQAQIILATGSTLGVTQERFSTSLNEYLQEVAFNQTYVSYAKIGTLLFSTTGVMDYQDLQINSKSNNINLGEKEVPTLGTITLEVI